MAEKTQFQPSLVKEILNIFPRITHTGICKFLGVVSSQEFWEFAWSKFKETIDIAGIIQM